MIYLQTMTRKMRNEAEVFQTIQHLKTTQNLEGHNLMDIYECPKLPDYIKVSFPDLGGPTFLNNCEKNS